MARRHAPGAATKRERRAAKQADDRDARLAFFEEARRYARYLGIETDEGRFVVSTRSEKIGKHLFAKRGRPEFGVLRRALSVIDELIGEEAMAGRAFIDIGASIGTSTISALRSHPFESAVCCEPEPENYRMLGANLALNDLDQVQRFRVAVSSEPGRAKLVMRGDPPGQIWIALNSEQVRDARARHEQRLAENPAAKLQEIHITDVELVTLDGLVENGAIDPDEAGMLWIDVEGHEGHVLAGAQVLAERGLPIVFEYDRDTLERQGDADALHAVVEQHYTHFVDLRRRETDRRRLEPRPVAELAEFGERYLEPELAGRFTDLLVVQLDAG